MAVCLSEIFDTQTKEVEIATDTRTIKKGDFFLPLVGENFDGHEFIEAALEKGAEGVFSAKEEFCKDSRVIKVEDTLEAYHKIAKHYLKKINPQVIAITGSSGKTTTKEMMRHVLAQKYKVHYSHANFNNEIGVPKTILEMPADTEVLILEMGMRQLGEIEVLSRIAEPDFAVITNIGVAHIELLGSRDNIRKAKLEIASHLKDSGMLFIDENLFNDLNKEKKLKDAQLNEDTPAYFLNESEYHVKYFDYESRYRIQGLAGKAIHADANAVAAVAGEIGLSKAEIQTGLDKYSPGKGRGSFHRDKDGNLFIDDSYNANPDSIKASVNALVSQFKDKPKVVVIGEIKESDDALIKETHEFIEKLSKEENLKFIRAEGKEIEAIANEIKEIFKEGGEHVALIKASRAAELERVLDYFKLD